MLIKFLAHGSKYVVHIPVTQLKKFQSRDFVTQQQNLAQNVGYISTDTKRKCSTDKYEASSNSEKQHRNMVKFCEYLNVIVNNL